MKHMSAGTGAAKKLKDVQAETRDRMHEKHAGASANLHSRSGAKHHDFLDPNAVKSMSGEAQLKAASHYEALAAKYEATASKVETHQADNKTQLSILGDAINTYCKSNEINLSKLDAKASIVNKWDKSGDGQISQVEFRLQVKGLGVAEYDVHKIDELFKQFDADESGFLDVSEIKVAFKRAVLAAREVAGNAKEVRDKAERLRQLAVEAAAVAATTAELEEEEASFKLMKESQGSSIEEKVSSLLAKRNAKVGDLVANDVNSDGVVDEQEFISLLRGYGLKQGRRGSTSDVMLHEFYEKLDSDHSGGLDIGEMKQALQKMQVTASKRAHDLTDEAEVVAQLVKLVARAQKAFDKYEAAQATLLGDALVSEEMQQVDVQ